jgi:uncharacterized protein (TIGR03905 family)
LKRDAVTNRFIFQTDGVCPPEIHFQIEDDTLKEVRFVGGGCPGNAQLVSRFLQGRSLGEVLHLLTEIDCRNGTSCPDQLAKALTAAKNGSLEPARSFQVSRDALPRNCIGLIGDLEGRSDVLEVLIQDMRMQQVETIYCLGNLTGNAPTNEKVTQLAKKEGILAIQGALDAQYALGEEKSGFPPLGQKQRDSLLRLAHVISFQMGKRKGVGFYGQYLQELPGYSDFEPFALEMNMICGLTDFMRDETVFPALEAMVPQLEAEIVVFCQHGQWAHWQIGGVVFIGLGPALGDGQARWGLLRCIGGEVDFETRSMEWVHGGADGKQGHR